MSEQGSDDSGTRPNVSRAPSSSCPADLPRREKSSRFSPRYHVSSIYNYNSPFLAHMDEDLLSRTISDTGMHAYGAVFIEVWVVSSDGRHVTRPSGGHWMDPVFMRCALDPDHANELNENAADCAPGESMAGTLFNETGGSWRRNRFRKVYWRQIKSMMEDPFLIQGRDHRMRELYDLGLGIVGTVPFTFQDRDGMVLFMSRSTVDVDMLRSEKNEKYLIGATDLIGAAFAIRVPRAECSIVRNELFQSAVGKVKSRIKGTEEKPGLADVVLQASEAQKNGLPKAPNNQFALPCGIPEDEWESNQPSASPSGSARPDGSGAIPESWKRQPTRGEYRRQLLTAYLIHKVQELAHTLETSVLKWRGSGLHAAPRVNLIECIMAWVGVFLVMLSLVRFDVWLKNHTENLWTLDAGWYSSSLCIVYAMTAAPSGQPPQIMLAHIWNAMVGYAIRQIPSGSEDYDNFYDYAQASPEEQGVFVLPVAWKQAMSVAFGVSGMAYLGILHPPATGLSFAFCSNSRWGPSNLIMILTGDLILISMSVIMLNILKFKQYPSYWIGFSWKHSAGIAVGEGWCTRREKEEQEDEADADDFLTETRAKEGFRDV